VPFRAPAPRPAQRQTPTPPGRVIFPVLEGGPISTKAAPEGNMPAIPAVTQTQDRPGSTTPMGKWAILAAYMASVITRIAATTTEITAAATPVGRQLLCGLHSLCKREF
jgi:hypothetical protein